MKLNFFLKCQMYVFYILILNKNEHKKRFGKIMMALHPLVLHPLFLLLDDHQIFEHVLHLFHAEQPVLRL